MHIAKRLARRGTAVLAAASLAVLGAVALDTDPAYRLARLSDQMIGSGLVAGWNMNKNTAYKTLPFD